MLAAKPTGSWQSTTSIHLRKMIFRRHFPGLYLVLIRLDSLVLLDPGVVKAIFGANSDIQFKMVFILMHIASGSQIATATPYPNLVKYQSLIR